MNNYHFTYRLSGKDSTGKEIKDTAIYHLNVKASTQVIAEKKLKATYFKSVKVSVHSVQVTEA